MAIKIDFLANTKDVVRGGQDIEETFEKVSDSLDDLAREGQRAGDKLGDGIADGAKQGTAANERLERSFKELADQSKKTTAGIGDDYKRSAKDAGEGLDTIKEESNSTAREAAASFDGSAESIGDAFQEVAANAFAGFGPAGALAGLAIAAGLGLGFAALAGGQEETEAFKETVADLGGQFIDAGQKGKRSFSDLVTDVKSLATQTDDSKVSLQDLKDIAKNLDEPFKRVTGAYLNGGDALDKLIKKNQGLQDIENARLNGLAAQGGFAGTTRYLADLESQNATLKEQKKAIEAAQQAQLDYLNSGATEFQVKASLIDQLNTAYDDAAGSTEDFINKESGLFDVGAYLAAMQSREKALADYRASIATSGLTPEARAFLQSEGEETAALQLQGYKTATPEQQAELNRIWSEAGKNNSGSYGAALTAGMPKTVPGPTIVPSLDISEAQAKLNRLTSQTLKVTIDGIARNGVKLF